MDVGPQHVPPPPEPRGRAALRVLQAGFVVAALAVVTWRAFELDRFYVPKELVLHLTALVAGLLAWRSTRRLQWAWPDALLLGYVVLGIVSVVLAQNVWLGIRALTMSASAAAVLWTARMLRDEGHGRALVAAAAVAIIAAAATSLLQTYGVRSDFFSINRAPGGTLGNRNSIAHLCALGLPVVLLASLDARRAWQYLLGAAGSAVLVAALVITRSRAGWLAMAAALAIFLGALLLVPVLRRRAWRRMIGVVVLAGAAVAGAVLLPNSLRWVDDNPYLSSMRDVANYREGSGAGRLVQYRQTLEMAASSPLLGVGPGNWAVVYPEHAVRRDPSMDPNEAGRTSNPWPSSDWVAFAAERGFIAFALLVIFFATIALGALRRLLRTADAGEALRAAALLSCIAGFVVAGLFDAVLLLALPALLAFAVIGALWQPAMSAHVATSATSATGAVPRAALFTVLLIAAVGVVRSTSQLAAMGVYANSTRTAWLARAAVVDPGNYALRLRLARSSSGLPRSERCAHALAARELYPAAATARALSRGCR